ncbi:hypothetical protein, partial [Marinobacter sp.]
MAPPVSPPRAFHLQPRPQNPVNPRDATADHIDIFCRNEVQPLPDHVDPNPNNLKAPPPGSIPAANSGPTANTTTVSDSLSGTTGDFSERNHPVCNQCNFPHSPSEMNGDLCMYCADTARHLAFASLPTPPTHGVETPLAAPADLEEVAALMAAPMATPPHLQLPCFGCGRPLVDCQCNNPALMDMDPVPHPADIPPPPPPTLVRIAQAFLSGDHRPPNYRMTESDINRTIAEWFLCGVNNAQQ